MTPSGTDNVARDEGRRRHRRNDHRRGRGTGGRARGRRLRRRVDGRDQPRPVPPARLAAEHTTTLELGTSIAVAFARNPMTLANIGMGPAGVLAGPVHPRPRQPDQAAHHQALLDGVEPPGAAHARDDPGDPGDLGHLAQRHRSQFRGEFYTHTLMTPFFTPRPADLDGFGVPKIFLAGVGQLMTEVAGEVCDGFLCHGFTTERYLREVTLPALERGPGQGRQDDGGLRDQRARLRRHRHERRGDRGRPRPARASRSRSTARPRRTGRCSSCTAGAACRTSSTSCRSRASGRRWATLIDDEMLNTFAVVGAARGDRRRSSAGATATSCQPDHVLRPVPQRPRALADGARSIKRRLTPSPASRRAVPVRLLARPVARNTYRTSGCDERR